MIYDTNVNPGHGIGNNLDLGMTLFDAIKHLNEYNYKYSVIYDAKNYYEAPLMIEIKNMHIRLTFSSNMDQKLTLIEILNLDQSAFSDFPLRLSYKNQRLNEFENVSNTSSSSSSVNQEFSPISTPSMPTSSFSEHSRPLVSVGPSFKTIYNKIFGPTYPGKLNLDKGTYTLSYPGIAFKFEILKRDLLKRLADKKGDVIVDELLNWDGVDEIVCSSIALFKGKSWDAYKEEPAPDQSKEILVDLDEGVVRLNEKEVIQIGKSTQQDIVHMLGPPDESFNKFDLRLSIHNQLPDHTAGSGPGTGTTCSTSNGGSNTTTNTTCSTTATSTLRSCKFHNYYKYGIDILYDLQKSNSSTNQSSSKATVTKVVLHNGGIAEDLNFMRWGRCNWRIKSSKFESFDSSTYFHQLPSTVRDLAPVSLNRYESEFVDNDLDIIEVPKSSSSSKRASEGSGKNDDDDAKSRAWGQSKLYGLDRCILEVLNSNACISSLTVF
ncbi:uncharacterized protein LODBEIA_P40270 [Lodderomyces beijingensis]|uniref:Uncharacterized protein n=1 Tax=Lodderomyces beijingensis TaxID=1775926 RepID=A0ABP0ZNT2_9ASCO